MGAFWESWMLWEKMCFVLGCAIVVTILAGCMRLVYKHAMLRKYIAIEAKKKESDQEMRHTAGVKRGRVGAEEIPFGVRAIESGIEVDGVWISRTNTPVHSSPASPVQSTFNSPSLRELQESDEISTASIPDLAMPKPSHGYNHLPMNRSRVQSKSPESFDRAVSAERLPTIYDSPDGNPRVRQTYRPRHSSQLRFSSGEASRNPTHGNGEMGESESRSSDEERASQHSAHSSTESNVIQHYMPRRYDHADPSLQFTTRNSALDSFPFENGREGLDSMATHRASHAAEMGQLTPRAHQTSSTLGGSSSHQDYFSQGPPSPNNPFESERFSFHESDSSGPLSYQNYGDADSAHTQRQAMPLVGSHDESDMRSNMPHSQGGDANRNTAGSHVVRKVNSGFEILKPGTFEQPSNRGGEHPEHRHDATDGGKRQSRKLQKRRQDSIPGRQSQFVEEV